MAEIRLLDGERIDRTGFGELVVVQGKGFSYGVDSVLLAAFANGETGAVRIQDNSRVMDLGTGNGIIPFIMSHKNGTLKLEGIEVQEISYDRAVRGLEANALQDRIVFHNMDVLEAEESFEGGSFDAVVSNPPYFRRGAAMISAASAKMIARHETTATLEDFLRVASRLLRTGGSMYMVHRPDRMVSILTQMRQNGLEPKALQLVTPHPGEAANILLVHGIKGAGEELRVLPDISVYGEGREYSDEIMRMYERI